MSEADLQSAVIELARLLGWRVAHFRPAQTAQGWRTPVQADGKGFPDLVLVRRERLVFAELKSARGRTSLEQQGWLAALHGTAAEVYLWDSLDWTAGTIEAALRTAVARAA
jgi:hypothetical protein